LLQPRKRRKRRQQCGKDGSRKHGFDKTQPPGNADEQQMDSDASAGSSDESVDDSSADKWTSDVDHDMESSHDNEDQCDGVSSDGDQPNTVPVEVLEEHCELNLWDLNLCTLPIDCSMAVSLLVGIFFTWVKRVPSELECKQLLVIGGQLHQNVFGSEEAIDAFPEFMKALQLSEGSVIEHPEVNVQDAQLTALQNHWSDSIGVIMHQSTATLFMHISSPNKGFFHFDCSGKSWVHDKAGKKAFCGFTGTLEACNVWLKELDDKRNPVCVLLRFHTHAIPSSMQHNASHALTHIIATLQYGFADLAIVHLPPHAECVDPETAMQKLATAVFLRTKSKENALQRVDTLTGLLKGRRKRKKGGDG